ncbi:MAG TPA: TonB-dependent receptor [Vicinamibacterales bacterium]|nr:TonB-dependent receptor [Vicinamibacterales bacterium]
MTRLCPSARLVAATAVAVLTVIQLASAQSESRISGVVRDATGASIPGVTVTATNHTNKEPQTATSGNDGTYSISVLPGTYSVSAAVQGFRRVVQEIDVSAGAPKTLDFRLDTELTAEVTVTASKREQAILDVPFSVAAPTEETLRRRGVQDLEGVAANVGGLTVQNLGPGQSQVAIRGVSAGQIVRDQPGVKEQVGVYLDESVISLTLFTPDLDLFDTRRVEVLRGPQGTLFGSGSLTGTVRYITNPPELKVKKAFAELSLTGVDGGNAGMNGKFGFNAPLGEKAAVRVVSYYDRIAGFIDAVQPDGSVRANVNDGFRTGLRAAARIATSQLAITPRIVYQRVEMDGWNRRDDYNILANPFTTTRPAVTLGGRSQFTQLAEKFTDDFVLGDVNLEYKLGNDLLLTSITSYTHRDLLVIRDSGTLTASVTGGNLGLGESIYTLDSPLNDATTAGVWTQEARVAGGRARYPWVAGAFFSRADRDYGQDLPVIGFEDLSGIPTRGLRAPKDTLFFSDLAYDLNQFALFGEVTVSPTARFSLTGGLRYYRFNEDKEQVFDGIFGNDSTGTSLVSQPGSTDADGVAPRVIASYKLSDTTRLNGQVSRGFRLGGINDPLNVPVCTPQDLATFSGRDTWDDEKVWNYEVGLKSSVWKGLGTFSAAGYYLDISDLQATVTAGSCSSRVVFNVPKARTRGLEIEFEAAPNRHVDFAVSATVNDSELRSALTSTDAAGNVSIVSGIQEGRRLPTVPRFQLVTAATYQWQVRPGALAYITGTYQHVGSRFTQVGDEDLGTLNLLSFGANAIGGPLTASVFTYNPRLPAYDLVNLRVGVRRSHWDIAFFTNNLFDELALLSFDQERGTRARIGFLTNRPRTLGISTRLDF